MSDPHPATYIKDGFDIEHKEVEAEDAPGNLEYTEDVEPALHGRTYMALFALFLLNMVQVAALNGPPSGVGTVSGLQSC